jgi:hypothetical protein
MTLDEYYFSDPRVVLVPIEHLSATGMTREFAALAGERAGWSAATVALFDAGFARYWERAASLARRTATWPPPRRRHVAVMAGQRDVLPWVQLLNTSAWLVYGSDLDPARSDPEFLAYLLAHGDWMVQTGEVAMAAVRGAAWWLERSDAECAAFTTAAARCTRPDAAAWRALAEALPWLRRLDHETLRPPRIVSPRRPIPGTGLLVPHALEREPLQLAARWTAVARDVVSGHGAAWRPSEPAAVRDLTDWLAGTAPPLLVTGAGAAVLWDPNAPTDVASVRNILDEADAVAVRAIHADLEVVAQRTEAFLGAVVNAAALPAPQANTFQSGYTYLHATRRLVAYNLHEPGMDRLHGPPLPFAREMVGARTAHEWAHLADAAGWVPRTVPSAEYATLRSALAGALDAAIAAAPAVVRRATTADLTALAADGCAGAALARLTLTRMPDYRANLVARKLLTEAERETYVRHNIRPLRGEYPPPLLWRMLIRYLFEYQYLAPALGMTRVAHPRDYFVSSTWFADDFLATGVLDEARFEALAAAVGHLCACHAVDRSRLRLPAD